MAASSHTEDSDLRDLVDSGRVTHEALKALQDERALWINGSVASDPFYHVEASAVGQHAGALLKLEAHTDTSPYYLPPGVALSRLIYQTRSLTGRLIPTSACLLWPLCHRVVAHEADKFPLVAWAHGSSGIFADSAPSHFAGLCKGFNGLFQLLTAGYAVLAPDYAGLGVEKDGAGEHIIHEYVAHPAHANDVAFGVQAARSAFSELSRNFAVVGVSQGGGTAWAVAQRQALEPMEGYLGAIAIAPVTDVLMEASKKGDDPGFQHVVACMVLEMAHNCSSFTWEEMLTDEAKEGLDLWKMSKGSNAMSSFFLEGILLLKPDYKSNTSFRRYINITANGRRPIDGPLYVIQGDEDSAISVDDTEAAVKETCEMYPNCEIDLVKLPGIGHDGVMMAGLPVLLGWIGEMFGQGGRAGQRVARGGSGNRKTADAVRVNPVRGIENYRTALDWDLRRV
ncbi:MAG: hypothetical protein Q9159_001630 [Coniocarpon cinnabarinum]